MRADIRERREIIAEHLRGQCSCALECLRPPGFTPRRAECRDFSWARAQCGLNASSCARPRTLSHILPPLVECRVLSFNRDLLSQTSVLSFSPSEEPFNQLINFRFAGRSSMNDFLFLLNFSFPALPI